MSSTLVSRNVTVGGRRTSIRLESDMWDALKEVCAAEGVSVHEFCTRVDRERKESSLTAAIRVALLAYYRSHAKPTIDRLSAERARHRDSPGEESDDKESPPDEAGG